MSSSLRKWFLDLPWMQQGVLLSSFRNCDGYRSEGPHKILIRGLRAACIKSARTNGSYNARRPNRKTLLLCVEQFVECHFDHMPIHFVSHLMHAAEVLAYKHPDLEIRNIWMQIYSRIVEVLHLNLESWEQFEERLKDDPEQIVREDEYDEQCYQFGDYEENTGVLNEGD